MRTGFQRFAVAVSLAGLAFRSVSYGQEVSSAETGIVAKAITSWERSTGISVGGSARREVEAAFGVSSLKDQLGRLKPSARTEALTAGVAEYLGDVRDSSGASKQRSVEQADLRTLPPGKAVAQLTQQLSRGPVGQLVITSRPPNANITIDGKAKGFTDKIFVVSAGTHDVAVKSSSLSCSKGVSVAEDSTVGFTCP